MWFVSSVECEGPLEKMLEHQWLEKWVCTQNMSSSAILNLLNSSLTNRTFLVSNHITICDVLWALSVKNAMVSALIFCIKVLTLVVILNQ